MPVDPSRRLVAFLLAVVLALVLYGSAEAHGGARVVFVPDGFGGARAVVVDDTVIVRGFHGPVVRGHVQNRSFFNQNGGRNRFGFRR